MRTPYKPWLDNDFERRARHPWDVGGDSSPHVRYARSLVRVREALLANYDQYAEFRAEPDRYLRRFGIDIRSLSAVSRKEVEALIGLQEREAPAAPLLDPRPADPAGDSEPRGELMLARSPIHGDGIYAGQPIPGGAVVCTVLQGDKLTDTASKVNRSTVPNSEMETRDGKLVLKTAEPIEAGRELVANYPLPRGS